MTDIALINRTQQARIRDARFAALVPSLQTALDRDFVPFWGAEAAATIHFVSRSEQPDPQARKIWLLDTSDQPGDLGYHEDDTGVPEAKIFIMDDLRYGAQISVTVDHEIKEMQADPLTTREVTINGVVYVIEVCDPVEADESGYDVGGFRMSNFVTPAYFGLPGGPPGRFDFMQQLAGPCPAVGPGGYLLWLKNGIWHTSAARHEDGSLSHRAIKRLGRSVRRAAAPG